MSLRGFQGWRREAMGWMRGNYGGGDFDVRGLVALRGGIAMV